MLPLERLIREMIAAEGPMRLDRYMGLCLGHPEHGYYMQGDPFGAEGDFITAPEVSQAFGELIGIWCVAAWQAMGVPDSFSLVELGPGRGTLMTDMLRTVGKAAPDFIRAAQVNFVETSPALRACQAKAIGTGVSWHDALTTVPHGPMILVANEFFDAIPIRQFEKRDGRWHERVIGLRDDRLVLGLVEADIGSEGRDGDIIEFAPERNAIAGAIGERLARRARRCADHRLRTPGLRARRHAAGDSGAWLRFDPRWTRSCRPDLSCRLRGAQQGDGKGGRNGPSGPYPAGFPAGHGAGAAHGHAGGQGGSGDASHSRTPDIKACSSGSDG